MPEVWQMVKVNKKPKKAVFPAKFPKKKAIVKGRLSDIKARKKFILDIWSEAVRLIWNGKCGMCGNGGSQAHHYFGKKAYPHMMFEVDNGVWTCFSCHIIKTHRMGRTEETRDAIIKKIGNEKFNLLKQAAYKIDENGEPIRTKTLTLANLDMIEKKLIAMINILRIYHKDQP